MKPKFLHNIQNKIYFIPSIYAVSAAFLSLFVIIIDRYFNTVIINYLPGYFFTSYDLAKTILSTLAGSLFAMITVSFSTIMVVLTMYSSQFSPRTMQDFLKNRVTLKVLGVFIGGFIYSILTLLFLNDNLQGEQEAAIFSPLIAVIVAIICLGYFVYFIHHAANSVQVNLLVENLKQEIIDIVNKFEERNNSNDKIRNVPPPNLKEITEKESMTFKADRSGYIQYIYDIQLTNLADELDLIIRAEKMIGDYVTENTIVFSVWQLNPSEEMKETKEVIEKKILDHLVIDNERSNKNDIEFGLLKLTEVALRAISPGINDPNTAVFCINQLGWVLSRIAVANIENTYYYNDKDELCFILEDISFWDLLYKTFYQLRHYGNQDVSVAGSILDALLIIAEGSSEKVKKQVWNFSHYILGGFDIKVLENEDKKFLNHKIYKLAKETKNSDKTDNYFQV
ncbi:MULTISPECIES: DUF2254 domain-containing protein [unclassified Halanaerobium]|uniref:DUF2254 domain-containing protein n=1 Tax=unclassified Halanaerobium TaxID=2641197 RepID=UPI000DF2C5B9|nr:MULTISPECIES: DUF2254 domain-containing protein [unclassified Halanaerobium]RCW43769.1 putative membrane protein [Halanaerobium sp. MA284_MarDTE_T2]RCW89162.1 putative membrane protein [Halanaerobium sp. DL-01]